ncbi:hypothetical protein AGDE_15385 [Angomonas deanei]|uniref:CRAL/TRIO domain containing protein, putative n=1 Tax=Angomonas deanei TaxID=59799 RepID=A0A7G2C2A1_9TRYP|nr:hypothetical protein AGDE_15385 [Angomonas deanei]CAD2212863.1 CRAL/TRIO domain containing protein, putative [Angomonas deanei]|eukprot:EPY19175.1 hypothetical protein AGDE_15385 [Angomonas deanei]
MAIDPQYQKDWDGQLKSGPLVLQDEHRRKNLQLYSKIKDILPIDDTLKVNDCDLLYRFLIGCHWHLDEAETRIRQYARLRAENKLNGIIAEPVEPEVKNIMTVMYGKDKEGYPCLWIAPDPAELTAAMKKIPTSVITRAQMRVMEMSRYVSRYLGMDRATYVIDLGKVTVSAINGQVISFLKEMMRVLQDYYPELMRRMLIFNSGWAVTGAWKVLKAFIDSRIQDKIKFESKPPSPQTLKDFITEKNILPSYGGTNSVDEMDDILQKEIKRMREGGTTTLPPSPPADGVDPNEDEEALQLYSLYNSFVFENQSRYESCVYENDEEGAPRLVLGTRSLASFADPNAAAVQAAYDLLSAGDGSEVSDNLDTDSNSDPQIPSPTSAELPSSHSGTSVKFDFTICMDGSTSAYSDGSYVGTIEFPEVFVSSAGVKGKETLSAAIFQETGHPLHEVYLVCDTTRHPRFIVSRNRIKSQIKVYTPAPGGEDVVVTDSTGKHFYSGEAVQVGKVGQVRDERNKKSGYKDMWVLTGREPVAANKSSITGQSPISRITPDFLKIPAITAGKDKTMQVFAEANGMSITYSGFFCHYPKGALLALSSVLFRLWEGMNISKDVKAVTEGGAPAGSPTTTQVRDSSEEGDRSQRNLADLMSGFTKTFSSSSRTANKSGSRRQT